MCLTANHKDSPACCFPFTLTSKVHNGNYNTDNAFISSADGHWSPWGQYSRCTKTCGGGSQYRTRTCDNPAPSSGGKYCPGPSQQTNACNTQGCPGNKTILYAFCITLFVYFCVLLRQSILHVPLVEKNAM